MWRIRGILLVHVLSILVLGLTALMGWQSKGTMDGIGNHVQVASAGFLACLFAQAWTVLYARFTVGLAQDPFRERAKSLRKGILRAGLTALSLLLAAVIMGSLAYSGTVPRLSHAVLAWFVLPAQLFALIWGGRRLLELEALLLCR
jgi:Na+/H+ antiporter NhaC